MDGDLDQLITSDLFDVPSARPPQFDELLRQQEQILAKQHLCPQDKERTRKNRTATLGHYRRQHRKRRP